VRGAAAVHCTTSGNNILSPPWILIAAGFLPASARPVQGTHAVQNKFDLDLSPTNYELYAMKFVF
jgi:hypothetical protein